MKKSKGSKIAEWIVPPITCIATVLLVLLITGQLLKG